MILLSQKTKIIWIGFLIQIKFMAKDQQINQKILNKKMILKRRVMMKSKLNNFFGAQCGIWGIFLLFRFYVKSVVCRV